MDSKIDLRTKAKDIRKTLDIVAISSFAVEKIRNEFLYKDAKNVLIYYPKQYELNLLGLLDDDKNFYLPKVNGQNLLICPFKKGDKLIKSSFNIMEPSSKSCDASILDLVILPALMADKQGYRLGYGGGFYDRFLDKYSCIKTILPVAEVLFVENLPHEKFDKKADKVIVL